MRLIIQLVQSVLPRVVVGRLPIRPVFCGNAAMIFLALLRALDSCSRLFPPSLGATSADSASSRIRSRARTAVPSPETDVGPRTIPLHRSVIWLSIAEPSGSSELPDCVSGLFIAFWRAVAHPRRSVEAVDRIPCNSLGPSASLPVLRRGPASPLPTFGWPS
jgi:hypothetical protein